MQRAVVAGDLEADVGASPVGELADPLGDGSLARVEHDVGTELAGQVAAGRDRRRPPITRAPLSRAS